MTFNLTNQSLNVNRVQSRWYQFEVTGLMPNTIYTITVDGADWAEGTRQRGKDFGAALVSDENGDMLVEVLMEIPFGRDRNFELPRTNTLQFQNEQVDSTNRRSSQVVINTIVIEFSNVNNSSKAQFLINRRLLLTAGPVQTLFPIE